MQPYGWWWGTARWYEHQNLRDQPRRGLHLAAVGRRLRVRRTLPAPQRRGSYVVPPAKAEEMYSPEVFGRSGIDQVVVE
jgi:hypothetical protein